VVVVKDKDASPWPNYWLINAYGAQLLGFKPGSKHWQIFMAQPLSPTALNDSPSALTCTWRSWIMPRSV
jgi:hypothetical protein